MMKRRRLNSPPPKDKVSINTENDELPECCLSRLPDDIIVNIFSRLTLLEAARTSVVSSRWRYLWTFTANLDFHAPKTMWNINTKIGERPNESEIEEKRSKYINWVGKVLELHRGRYINEFRIHFDLGDNQKSYITNWIHTALAKGVQMLELNFHRFVGINWKEYRFPVECYNTLKSSHGLSIIKSLRSLSLKFVDVNTEIVEFFIYNCPYLERLSVFGSKTLLSLKVAGSSIQLKHLDINCCHYIKEVEISASSLLSFKYYGPQIKLHVQNVPLLLDVSIGGRYDVQLKNLIDPIIQYLSQLETLELLLDLKKDRIQFPHFELPKLRHLIFKVIASDHHNLLNSTQIIKACPFLHKFTLKLICGGGKRELHEFPKCPLEHLKVVEFIGFVGRPIDLELAFYFLENASMLEKMIVNPTCPFLMGSYFEFENSESKQAARKRVKQLKKRVPRGVQLVVC
ncbi:hypothetical protein Ddye_002478 [Dipteronia dyeriana]|uniref:F-box domain-containing protein n=1 Tax=Dipteronia dyeriana TaxID=168575 RepID=A0AAD9XQI1_9ROSI|nr:hypothetical protein Ddye_002478 [Dipteronia dyeriana]